ncbi:glycoside hydrolase family 2 TIM barrel-domain containing protein [Arcticibacter svalbardensis]|nr:glycoside hydrolase family 2 TIM barrel-domain containing protein [Arcticibacter svalbardensis]
MSATLSAQEGRLVTSFNGEWLFAKDSIGLKKSIWTKVNIPHSWNKEDVTDDTPGYYRGVGWYKKNITIHPGLKGKKIFLYFEGANQETEVYVNGKKAGRHVGGYTRFCLQIDPFLNFQDGTKNEVLVKVDNKFNEDIPPLSADFTFFGGIYRDVYVVTANPVHFSFNRAANGVFLSTPVVSAKTASVHIRSQLINQSSSWRKLIITNLIKDHKGAVIAKKSIQVRLKAGAEEEYNQQIDAIVNPQLWSPENPYLYTVITQIVDAKTKRVLDLVSNPLGFRWFKFDAASGFYLNGKPYKLIGASRHQDFKAMANALPNAYHVNDIKLLKKMGANFLRVAHYPQDPAVLESCDRLGILTSVEIPIVNAITESEAFYQHCKDMQVEMIRQNYNHPSVILWAYMNEVLLRLKFTDDKPRQQIYFDHITRLAEQLDSLTRKEDPSRYTMISNHGDFKRYKQTRLIEIPMVVGWNLYQGWYSGNIKGFADFLDQHHKEFPEKPVMVTEYGADADPRIHSLTPERFDKSMEYSLDFHEYYLKTIQERPFVAAGMIWNLSDFNSESREETMPHINNKGLLTLDRQPKDLYRFYQSRLLKTPYVKISNWLLRGGLADSTVSRTNTQALKGISDDTEISQLSNTQTSKKPSRVTHNSAALSQDLNSHTSTQPLEVFSNADDVSLFLNGEFLKGAKTPSNRFIWQVPFKNGLNTVEALIKVGGKEYRDVATINFTCIPRVFAKGPVFDQLHVLLGAKRIYIDEDEKAVWLPDQVYQPGGWGHIGGEIFKMKGNARQSYGTDRNIIGTDRDPIYQTQNIGIKKYKLDVPDGDYNLVLHFAELISADVKEALAYNLDNSSQSEKVEERIFDVFINDVPVLQRFSPKEKYGALTAGSEEFKLTITNGKGIEITFKVIKGQPVLNALQLIKN